MSSVIQTFQKHTQTLPLSQSDLNPQPCIRRRLSSLSLHIQPTTSYATAWALRRTKSVSSASEHGYNSIRKWWEWGWTWVLSRKPTFAGDIEINEEESAMLGFQSKGSLRHMFYKVRAQIRRLLRSDNVGLPQTFRYDSFNYQKNIDHSNSRSFRS